MASPTAQSTGLLLAGTYDNLYQGKNIINGVIAMPGSTVTVFDNTTATGKVVAQVVNAGTNSIDHVFNLGIRCDIAFSILITGASGAGIVYFGAN